MEEERGFRVRGFLKLKWCVWGVRVRDRSRVFWLSVCEEFGGKKKREVGLGFWGIDGTRGRDWSWERGKCKAMLHGRVGEERKRNRHMWTVPTRATIAASATATDGSSSVTLCSSNSFCKVCFWLFWFWFWFKFFCLFVWLDLIVWCVRKKYYGFWLFGA